jgi:hypothetical protein
MKKLLLFAAIILISIQGYSQKTSADIYDKIHSTLGINKVLVDEKIIKLFDEYTELRVREIRHSFDKVMIVDVIINAVNGFCFTCQCPYCGKIVLQGNGDCGMYPGGCGNCPSGDGYRMQAYVQNCEGSPCGNIIGAN